MEDIEHYDIPVYNFPYDVEEDDDETIQDNRELRVSRRVDGRLVHVFINILVGPFTICHHRFGRRDRDRWAACPCQDIPLGCC